MAAERGGTLKSGIETCCCGAVVPPSVSLQAERIRMWLALLECPACGSVVSAVGYEPVGALAQATFRWNARRTHGQASGFTLSIRYH